MDIRPFSTNGGQENEGGGVNPAPLVAHPASRLFPPMTDTEFTELCTDIAAHGLEDAIVLFDGQILEGNNRYRACLQTGVAPKFTVWDGDDPITYVISKNLHRRHLTPGQKAAIAVEAEAMYKEAARQRQAHGQTAPGKTLRAHSPELEKGRALDQAAQAVGASRKSAQDAKAVKADSAAIFDELKNGTISIRQALKATGRKGGGNNHQNGQRATKTAVKPKGDVPEHIAAQARIRASDAELKYQSMLNAPEGKLNIPLLDRASKIQELLLEVTGLTPEKAVSQIPAMRCREYSPEMARWWLRFAELCEERRRTETPELPTLYKRSRLPSLNPVVVGGPVAPAFMSPTMQAVHDWIKKQTDPVTVVEVAVAAKINRSSAGHALRNLTQTGVIEVIGRVGSGATAYNLYRLKGPEDDPPSVS